MKRSSSPSDTRLLGIVAAVVVIATLYFARSVFIPFALAALFSLILTPVVSFLERLRFPRVLAIIFVVLGLIGAMGLLGWETSQQFVDVSNNLPDYKVTLQEKIHALRGSGTQTLDKASSTVRELEKEIAASASTPGDETKPKTRPTLGASPEHPMAVEVVPPANPLESVETMLGPIANAGVVVVFTIFILAGREDLRNRLIRLAGHGRLNIMTQALDDAAQRINRYLFMQLLVNAAFGAIIGVSLHFIGIPNAALWGVGAGILRFMPYVGPILAALMPILLSLAIFPGWHHALETAGLFLFLELIVGNVAEPLLYGAHVGLSPLAILLAAVFWTLIWGFPGLVLSTPLTVCLVVMGRYVPSLSFLNVMLGDDEVLAPHAQLYQRLLAADQVEAQQVVDQCLKSQSLQELYSSVMIPALGLAENDRHSNELDEQRQTFIYQSTREMIGTLADTPLENDVLKTADTGAEYCPMKLNASMALRILCIPARDEADEIVAMLLCQLLERSGHKAQSIPIGTTAEMLAQVRETRPDIVCISALPPFAQDHARALYARIHAEMPELHSVVCLWQFEGDPHKAAIRMKIADGQDALFTTLPEVMHHVAFRAESAAPSLPVLQTAEAIEL